MTSSMELSYIEPVLKTKGRKLRKTLTTSGLHLHIHRYTCVPKDQHVPPPRHTHYSGGEQWPLNYYITFFGKIKCSLSQHPWLALNRICFRSCSGRDSMKTKVVVTGGFSCHFPLITAELSFEVSSLGRLIRFQIHFPPCLS